LLRAGLLKKINYDQTVLRHRMAGMQQCMPPLWRDKATLTLPTSVASEEISTGTVLNCIYWPSKMGRLRAQDFKKGDEIYTSLVTAKKINEPLGIQVDDPSCW
jgi:hypothetical protein